MICKHCKSEIWPKLKIIGTTVIPEVEYKQSSQTEESIPIINWRLESIGSFSCTECGYYDEYTVKGNNVIVEF